jgi:uncharacterized membrane protein YfcA
MSVALIGLLGALSVFTLTYLVGWFVVARDPARRALRPEEDNGPPTGHSLWIGAFTNFFDTWGIGSFAPTTALFKFFKQVPDERIPGTLNVGHTLPTILQAFIFITAVAVEPTTLVALIVTSVLGAWLGAGIVAGWSRRQVQIGMGTALLAAGLLFVSANLGWTGAGGEAIGLTGGKLAVALAGNFMLGALMTLGVGLYAPSLIMLSLLGMNPLTAFPIMMGSCAFLMPVASLRFMRAGAFRLRPALGLAIGGLPAVWVAARILVNQMDQDTLRWLVAAVVLFTSITMLRSAARRE